MPFRPMLAAKFEENAVQRLLEEHEFLYMQPKIDGMRVLIDESAIPRSRSGKEHKNKYLRDFCRHHPSLRGFDGEVVSGLQYSADSFRESMSGIRAEDGSPEFTFYAFDFWQEPVALLAYGTRQAEVDHRMVDLATADYEAATGITLSDGNYTCRLLLTPTTVVYSLEEIRAEEERLLVAGWEGGILRHPIAPYKFNRATPRGGELIKLKRFEDDEAVIVGCYPWEHNANEATQDARGYTARSSHQDNKRALDRLGGFHCELLRDRAVKFDIGVFRGWGHSDRDSLWRERDSLNGRILKFKHQGYGGGYDRPRTPVGLGWRDADDLG
jgi:DNA ligase-1